MPFNHINTNNKTTFFIGDIHGEFKAIAPWIKQYNLHDCNIFFCGDFGLGFEKHSKEVQDLYSSNKTCEEHNVDCYIIRGNHDKPDFYQETPFKAILSRFKTLPDYTVVSTPEHNILCIGGAVSVDREYRKLMREEEITKLIVNKHYKYDTANKKAREVWWPDETFKPSIQTLEEITEAGINIDTVCTHTAPNIAFPAVSDKDIYWSRLDKELEYDLKTERQLVCDVYNYLKEHGHALTNWFYGHYHNKHVDVIDNTTFRLLDMGRSSKEGSAPGGVFDMVEL